MLYILPDFIRDVGIEELDREITESDTGFATSFDGQKGTEGR